MRLTCLTCLMFLALALAPLTALAAPARNDTSDADAAARQAQRPGQTQVYIYDDEQLDGESLRPDHERITQRNASGHANLISVRMHFIPQLLGMANDV